MAEKTVPHSGKMKRERCYSIPTKDGESTIRIRASKRPTGKTLKALQNLFAVALKNLTDCAQ